MNLDFDEIDIFGDCFNQPLFKKPKRDSFMIPNGNGNEKLSNTNRNNILASVPKNHLNSPIGVPRYADNVQKTNTTFNNFQHSLSSMRDKITGQECTPDKRFTFKKIFPAKTNRTLSEISNTNSQIPSFLRTINEDNITLDLDLEEWDKTIVAPKTFNTSVVTSSIAKRHTVTSSCKNSQTSINSLQPSLETKKINQIPTFVEGKTSNKELERRHSNAHVKSTNAQFSVNKQSKSLVIPGTSGYNKGKIFESTTNPCNSFIRTLGGEDFFKDNCDEFDSFALDLEFPSELIDESIFNKNINHPISPSDTTRQTHSSSAANSSSDACENIIDSSSRKDDSSTHSNNVNRLDNMLKNLCGCDPCQNISDNNISRSPVIKSNQNYSKITVIMDVLQMNSRTSSEKETSSRRSFPGPAGLLPATITDAEFEKLMLTENTENSIHQKEILLNSSQDISSNSWRTPWDRLNQMLNIDTSQYSILKTFTVAWLKRKVRLKQLSDGKMPFFCAVIKSVTIHGLDASSVLKDNTGEISATIHRELMTDYSTVFKTGAILLLHQLGVFSPTARKHYLNITPRNMICGCIMRGQELKICKSFEGQLQNKLDEITKEFQAKKSFFKDEWDDIFENIDESVFMSPNEESFQ